MLSLNLCELPAEACYHLLCVICLKYTLMPLDTPYIWRTRTSRLTYWHKAWRVKKNPKYRFKEPLMTMMFFLLLLLLLLIWYELEVGSRGCEREHWHGNDVFWWDGLAPACQGTQGVSGCQTQSETGYKSNVSGDIKGAHTEKHTAKLFFLILFIILFSRLYDHFHLVNHTRSWNTALGGHLQQQNNDKIMIKEKREMQMTHKVLVGALAKIEEVFKYHCFFLQGRPSFTLPLPQQCVLFYRASG